LRTFTFLESQNIIWTPFKKVSSRTTLKENLDSHSEKVKYKGNPCPNFLLKRGLDDNFFERRSR
jgi:hypothetical protein